jgi:Mrp family chromosome partitioning ATPase
MSEPMSAPASAQDGADGKPEGTVVTFYSYKGGVGRSMALANIGWLLADKYGKNVILVDWDLEAPGLHRFFGIADDELNAGVIDYVISYQDALKQADRPVSENDILLTKYLQNVGSFPSGGSLRLISAGQLRDRADYVRRVRTFNWRDFYDNWNGAQLIEAMRTQFRHEADFTLVDSRTGLTDIGGVCTVQLPDTVVFVFTYNSQNIDGIETVATELSNRENPTLAALQRWPTLHFLPSRRELSEPRRLRDWETAAANKLSRFSARRRSSINLGALSITCAS